MFIFNDQGRCLFQRTKGTHGTTSEMVDEDAPLVGFVCFHNVGSEWPGCTFDFPLPPAVKMDGDAFGASGFEVPANAPDDFDWQSGVREAVVRLEKERRAHE
jgi:hypothetical protein